MRFFTSDLIKNLAASDPKDVADELRSADLLPKSTYDEISSDENKKEIARKIVIAVTDKVVAQSTNFRRFVLILQRTNLHDLAVLLEDQLIFGK